MKNEKKVHFSFKNSKKSAFYANFIVSLWRGKAGNGHIECNAG